jgi:hypothetical protein
VTSTSPTDDGDIDRFMDAIESLDEEPGLDLTRLARALQTLDTPVGGYYKPIQPYYDQAEAIAAEYNRQKGRR